MLSKEIYVPLFPPYTCFEEKNFSNIYIQNLQNGLYKYKKQGRMSKMSYCMHFISFGS